MRIPRRARTALTVLLAVTLVCGVVVAVRSVSKVDRTRVVAYFDNSNGIFEGDEVRVLGVPVGKIDRIEPQPLRAKITFWFDDTVKVPADADAVIISPGLVTDRAIQLTPAYTGGPVMQPNAVIPQDRTAIPVEWDDFRQQLEKLTESLQPTEPGGVSTLGEFVNTAADNLRDQGPTVRKTIIELSQAFSALGDHSTDIFSTVKNLSRLVSALQSSTDLMRQLNQNMSAVTAVLANDPDEVGTAINDVDTALRDVRGFLADHREVFGTSTDKLASISTALADSLDDVKQMLHVLPNALQNFMNVYEPAHASLSGVMAVNNFANPISFLCGAIQAASRLGNEQAAKLCVQYLAPIVKNRQYNFLPVGMNFLANAQARPNEITFSEDWMRPDHVPMQPADASSSPPPLAAEEPVATDPAAGLPGMMVPAGGGR